MMRILTFLSLAMLDLIWFDFVHHLYVFSGQHWLFLAESGVVLGRILFWLVALFFDHARR